jgi:hypothetical protein
LNKTAFPLALALSPQALLHFLGGAFVSPVPQVAYRHLLEVR